MKLLFRDISVIDEGDQTKLKTLCVGVSGRTIDYIGECVPDGRFDRVIDGRGKLLLPGFYNTHCHSAMTLFRSMGDDLPLKRWLDDVILPAEERLNDENVRCAADIAIAEMLAGGIVSVSDMYFHCDKIAEAYIESGMKANISRSVVSFDDGDPAHDIRALECLDLFGYDGEGGGRIKIDVGIHAEYSNTEKMTRYLADIARERKAGVQLHLSETEAEHEKSKQRRGKTPAEFFRDCGVFDSPTTAAHCVWISDTDIQIMKEYSVTASHNPVSNLKLASGVMPLEKLLCAGVNVAFGTDGAASNNTLSILKELQFAAVLHKGVNRRADIISAAQFLPMLSENGARSQRREHCGKIEYGYSADFTVLDTESVHYMPLSSAPAALCYNTYTGDVSMTVCDGVILYENGEYTTIDIEKTKHDFARITAHYFD